MTKTAEAAQRADAVQAVGGSRKQNRGQPCHAWLVTIHPICRSGFRRSVALSWLKSPRPVHGVWTRRRAMFR
jgi:hypothetical protein